MHTGTLKKLALALTFWLALHASSLRAQVFTNEGPLQDDTTGTNPVDFEFRTDGTLIAKGNLDVGSLLTADMGAGTKMFWFPDLAAFRAGYVSGTQWDQSNIGEYSVAFGSNTTASGLYSTASGYTTTASGNFSTAFGYETTASNGGAASFGFYSVASGWGATAYGAGTTASGNYSLTMGYVTTASGSSASAFGYNATASGNCSVASGVSTSASAYASVAIGAGNIGGGNPTEWIATDPLFEVGNGTLYGTGNPTATGPADAFVVYKNGDAAVQGNLAAGGVITAAPGGDIPMYSGD
jgi:hypothetical protein